MSKQIIGRATPVSGVTVSMPLSEATLDLRPFSWVIRTNKRVTVEKHDGTVLVYESEE